MTGLALREQPDKYKAISSLDNVELGGHGWDSLKNHTLRTALWVVFGSRYGPKAYQRHEIGKTIAAFKSCVGCSPQTWRGHAYYVDENTYELLRRAGIRVVSDEVVCFDRPDAGIQQLFPGLWSVPINTMPDHDTVMHAKMSQAGIDAGALAARSMRDLQLPAGLATKQRLAMAARRAMRHAFDIRVMPYSAEFLYINNRVQMFPASEWEGRLREQISGQLEKTGFATLLLHPVCKTALDDMASLQRIFAFCRSFPSRFMSEPVPH